MDEAGIDFVPASDAPAEPGAPQGFGTPAGSSSTPSESHGVSGLASHPASQAGGPVSTSSSSTAAAAVIQGSISTDAGQAMAAAAKAMRRQQRAEELRSAVLVPVNQRSAQQVNPGAQTSTRVSDSWSTHAPIPSCACNPLPAWQMERVVEFLASTHVLRHLQPTILRTLGQVRMLR